MNAAWRTRAVAMALSVLSVLAATFIRAHAAPAPAHYFAYDQRAYIAMARAPFSSDAQVHRAPYCWRILAPLAARYVGMLGGGPERGFFVVTFAAFALLPLLTWMWLAAFDVSRTAAIGCAAAMALAPPVVGLFAWDTARVDAFCLVLLFLSALATVHARGPWILVLVCASVLTKEVGLVAACFALMWGLVVNRRILPWAAAAFALAIALRVMLPRWIPAPPELDPVRSFHAVADSLSVRYVARRLLLVTAGTFNLLVPATVAAMVTRRWSAREWVFTASTAIVMAQLIVAGDNERLVAPAYPFVMIWAALGLDLLDKRTRRWAVAAIVLAQVPWLLALGRVWPVPPAGDGLPHFPPLRYAEIVVVLGSAAIAVACARGSAAFQPARS